MSLTYSNVFKTKSGDSVSVSASDSDVIVLELSAQGMKLDLQDASNFASLIQAAVQLKAADLRQKKIAP